MKGKRDPGQVLRDFVARFHTQGLAAAALGINQAYLSDLLRGKRLSSANMLEKLGLERIVIERKAS